MNLPPVKNSRANRRRVVEYRDRIANLDHSMSRELRALLQAMEEAEGVVNVAIGS
jgi:hypothetical protein